jgi:hypothetical protein
MRRRDRRTNPRRIACRQNPSRWPAMAPNSYPEPSLWHENPLLHHANRSSSAKADAALEFGRFCVLLRERQLLADRVPVELGTRAFDLLLVLLEADGSLVTKEEILSRVCGRALWFRKRTSRFKSPRCAKCSARIATLSARNSAAVTDSPVCCARMPRPRRVKVPRDQACGRVELGFRRAVGYRPGVVSIRA